VLEEIARLCEFLPLALRVVGAQIARDPSIASRIADDLRDALLRLRRLSPEGQGVAAAFKASAVRLPEGLQLFFWLCGLHPGPRITADNVAALAACEVHEAKIALADLLDANLLIEREPTVYAMHDLVKDYAQKRCRSEIPEERQRVLLNGLCAWYIVVLDRGGDVRWLSDERTNVVALCMATPGRSSTELALKAGLQLMDMGYYSETEQLSTLAAVRYADEGDIDKEAQAVWMLGNVSRLVGDYASAESKFGDALRLFSLAANSGGEVKSLWGLAEVAYLTGEYQRALNTYADVLSRHQRGGDIQGVADAEWAIATVIAYSTGDLERAEARFTESLELYRRLGNARGVAMSYWGLADVARMRGDYDAAKRYYGRTRSDQRSLGNRREEADALWGLGDVACKEGLPDVGEGYFHEALKIHEEIRNTRGRANALWGLGEVNRLRGRTSSARERFRQALDLHRRLGNKKGQVMSLIGLGKLALSAGDFADASNVLKEIQRNVSSLGEPIKHDVRAIFGDVIR
jgi:tetratricopeptide (TPR) repeat protein